MKTHSIPPPPVVRVIGRSLLVVGLAGGAILLAQDLAPTAPAPAPPAAAEEPAATAPPRLPIAGGSTPTPPARPEPPVPALPPRPVAPAAGVAAAVPEPPVPVVPPAPIDPPAGLPGALPGPAISHRGSASASSGGASSDARSGSGLALPGSGGSAGISSSPRPARATASLRGNGRVARNLARAVVDEDLAADPQDVIRNYEAMVADFDSQREDAARAVVRLGEAYRKLGRLEEARVQFARVLREFVDFPDLARLSQQQLAQQLPSQAGGGNVFNLPPAPSAEERSLLEDELGLLGQQLARAQELVKTGTTPDSSLFPIQRDILHIKQQLARLSAATPKVADPTIEAANPPRSRSRAIAPPLADPPSAPTLPPPRK